jgi:hypothetical protein
MDYRRGPQRRWRYDRKLTRRGRGGLLRALAAVFAASGKASFISGQVIAVNGGKTAS